MELTTIGRTAYTGPRLPLPTLCYERLTWWSSIQCACQRSSSAGRHIRRTLHNGDEGRAVRRSFPRGYAARFGAHRRRQGKGMLAETDVLRRTATLQAAYFLVTGLWPIVSRPTFEAVTGPKTDYWLVRTVGALASVIGTTLGVASYRNRVSSELAVLGIGSACLRRRRCLLRHYWQDLTGLSGRRGGRVSHCRRMGVGHCTSVAETRVGGGRGLSLRRHIECRWGHGEENLTQA
jgi:hypothetical protein